MPEIEIHPFKPFIPPNASVLIVGSFPGREQTVKPAPGQWFYGSRRNQLWTILRAVYNVELPNTAEKKALFTKYGIAITDIFLKIHRTENNNLDNNLEVIEYNDRAITKILEHKKFKTVFFTSKFVEKHFKKLFPAVENAICLPSPSPRYARMSLAEKIEQYKTKLPDQPAG